MSTPAPKIEFWYDFASTYSYLSAMRIEDAAKAAGVEVLWKPFLLGPIFYAQGWNTSPFNLYPAKGRYMVREMERMTAARGLPFKMPSPFPQNSLLAARLALIGHEEGWGIPFSRRSMPPSLVMGPTSPTGTFSPQSCEVSGRTPNGCWR